MSWQILIAISVISFSISTLLQKLLLKNNKSDPVALAVLFQFMPGLIILFFALIHGYDLSGVKAFLPNIILSSLLYSGFNIFMFKSLKKIDLSIFTVIMSSRAIWTIFGAILVLNENFNYLKILGTLLILLSVVLVSLDKKKFTLGKGELYAFLASMFLGIGFVNDAFTVNHVDVLSYEATSFLLTSIFIALLVPKSIKKTKDFFCFKRAFNKTCFTNCYLYNLCLKLYICI